jgi:xanthine dehydrogenase accessory factor
MRDILPDIETWLKNHEPVALATVVQTWGSSPRGVGSKMAMTPGGKIAGSVSGGCVEGAVFETGVEVLRTGQPQLIHFGVADETAWQVGLACGGQVDIFVQPLSERSFISTREKLNSSRTFAVATVIRGPQEQVGRQLLAGKDSTTDSPTSSKLESAILDQAHRALSGGQSHTVTLETAQDLPVELFIEVIEPPPTLIMVGGVHIAIALTHLARALGYRTVVIDPRSAFINGQRFPHADQLIHAWPDDAFAQLDVNEGSAIAILTHDPKIDDPALLLALPGPAFYVGALGSPSTQAKRRERLLQAGMSEELLSRLHGPIGLRLGAQSPEEIALSILAEIVAVKHEAPEPIVTR